MLKIMVVEDDYKLRLLIKESLERYGFLVMGIDNFKDIELSFIEEAPDLVILDVTLPYHDGFSLCRMLRRRSNIPIIIASARDSQAEQVMGLELGADDYITKPFDIEILVAKVKAALRRVYGEYAETSEQKRDLSVNGLSLDGRSLKLMYQGAALELSKNEFKLIKKFLESPDKVISREELLVELWDDSCFVDDNTLTVNITRVKGKLEQLGLSDVVKTKRGMGYSLDSARIEATR